MPTPPITLVRLPVSLRKGIDRRLPRGAKFKNLKGKKYKRCRVLEFAGYKGPFAAWLCRCQCGRQFVAIGAYLTNGESSSCGCGFRLSPLAKKLQTLLQSIKARCYNPANPSYPRYGRRGITVCKRWRESIEAFAQDVGPRPSPNHALLRRNKGGNYSPSNCYWGTPSEALRGSRRAKEITYNGKTQCMSAWARELGIKRQTLQLRVIACEKRGLDRSLAITHLKGQWWPRISARRKRA